MAYQLANLSGASLICVNTFYFTVYGPFILNFFWALIALNGIKTHLSSIKAWFEIEQGGHNMALKDKGLYKGFDQEMIDRWNKEIDEKYDREKVSKSRRNLKNMSKDKFQDVKKKAMMSRG